MNSIISFAGIFSFLAAVQASSNVFLNKTVNQGSVKVWAKRYDSLYARLQKGDYGFAGFGAKCKLLTGDEMQSHLDFGFEMIRDHKEHGKYSHSVGQHLHPKLTLFFEKSQKYCEFRKLFSCSKATRKCECVLPSLELSKTGSCQAKLGHPCKIKEGTIPFTSGIPENYMKNLTKNSIPCITKRSECVSNTSLCKCKKGYFGPNCEPSLQSERSQKTSYFRSLTTLPLSTKEETLQEEDLYITPEDIKKELLDLLHNRDLLDPEEREEEASTLYKTIEADNVLEEMVMRDIHIRRLSTLKLGETCDPDLQLILENPPLAKAENAWVDPKPKDVLQWQLFLLRKGKPLCNPAEHLTCNATSRKCECRQSLFQEGEECKVRIGQLCGKDHSGPFVFGPLRASKRFFPPSSPVCAKGTQCLNLTHHFTNHCWCNEDDRTACEGEPPLEDAKSLYDFKLNLGEECNPEFHAAVLNPSQTKPLNVTELKERFGANQPLCKISSLLNCSEVTKTCTCFAGLFEEDGECSVGNGAFCGSSFKFGEDNELFPSSSHKLWQLATVLNTTFNATCINAASCSPPNSENQQQVCNCKDSTTRTGVACTDFGSEYSFALGVGLNSPKINTQPYQALKTAFSINAKMLIIQNLSRLTMGSSCNPILGMKADNIFSFFHDAINIDKQRRGRNLYHFERTDKLADRLLIEHPEEAFCNNRHGLTCDPLSSTCSCPKGFVQTGRFFCDIPIGHNCIFSIRQVSNGNLLPPPDWLPQCQSKNCSDRAPFVCLCKSGENCSEPVSSKDGFNSRAGKSHDLTHSSRTGNSGQNALVSPVPKTHDDKMHREIKEVLALIMNTRALELDAPCNQQNEDFLTDSFPALPKFTRNQFRKIKNSRMLEVYTQLRQFEGNKTMFCSRKKFLSCSAEGKCDCNPKVFRRERQSCRLLEGQYCGEIGVMWDKSVFPLPPVCMTGTKCKKPGYGRHFCYRENGYD